MRAVLIGTVLVLFFALLSCGLLMTLLNNDQLSRQVAHFRERLGRVEKAYEECQQRLGRVEKAYEECQQPKQTMNAVSGRSGPSTARKFIPIEVSNYERLDLVGPDPNVRDVPMYSTLDGQRPKSLVAIAAGTTGLTSGLVDKMVSAFGNGTGHFTILLFHYDLADYSVYSWYKHLIHITVPRQMKWWYAKRFLTPQLVSSYEFLFLWDEDLDVWNFRAQDYLEQCRLYGLALSTPAYDLTRTTKNSTWRIMSQAGSTVRKTDFVEVSAPVFRSDAWTCVWETLQNDLATGWGYDLIWYNACSDIVANHTGIIDSNPVAHISGDSASGSQNFRPRARLENKVFAVRVPVPRVRPLRIKQPT